MVTSQNSSVSYTTRASSLNGLPTQGDIMVGNAAFEYYNERNKADYIQIPWDEIDYVAAEVLGRHIARFAIFTTAGAHFSFSARDNKACLRALREHIGAERLVRSKSFPEVIAQGLGALPRRLAQLFHRTNL